jgi:hypothetical protein
MPPADDILAPRLHYNGNQGRIGELAMGCQSWHLSYDHRQIATAGTLCGN